MSANVGKTNLSAFLNFLLSRYEAFRGELDVQCNPYYALIDPSDICQLRCPGCWTGMENESRRNRSLDVIYRSDRSKLAPDLFDAIMNELGEYLFVIDFHTQGEPLLNQHLPSFVRKASEFGIDSHLRTNLSLELSDERIEDLVTCGLSSLIASVDGFTQEAYEKYRVGGRIDLVKQNLQRLVTAANRLGSDTAIVYQFLVFSWNEHEIEDVRKFSQEMGINYDIKDAIITDKSWLPSHRTTEKPFVSAEHIGNLAKEWEAVGAGDYWKETDQRDNWIPAHSGLNWIPPLDEGKSFCTWLYSAAIIEPAGHLTPCCWSSKEGDRLGAVSQDGASVRDVWQGEPYRRCREASTGAKLEPETLCSRCYLPDRFQHALAGVDRVVQQQFASAFGSSKPELTRAFELLVEGASEEHRDRYIEYYQAHVADHVILREGTY